MLVYRFSDENLRQLRKLLLHANDTFCNSNYTCVGCPVEMVCEQLSDIYVATLHAECICITVTREK